MYLAGQTCGSYYGDCRGLPTYAIITIISTGILLLSICIRCCVQMSSNNNQRAVSPTVPTSIRNPGHVRVQVYSVGVNGASRSPTCAPVHNIVEEAPPSYAATMSANPAPPKY